MSDDSTIGTYVARIADGREIGRFATQEEARQAGVQAAIELFREQPDSQFTTEVLEVVDTCRWWPAES